MTLFGIYITLPVEFVVVHSPGFMKPQRPRSLTENSAPKLTLPQYSSSHCHKPRHSSSRDVHPVTFQSCW